MTRTKALLSLLGIACAIIAWCAIMYWAVTPKLDAIGAESALEQAGYSHIQIVGASWGTCPRGYPYRTAFRASGPAGSVASGTVCGALDGTNIIALD